MFYHSIHCLSIPTSLICNRPSPQSRSCLDIRDGTRDQHANVPLVREHDLLWDRVRRALGERAAAAEQGRLKTELGLLGLAVDARAKEDEAVRVSQSDAQRRPATPHRDLVPLVADHLEVVRELQPDLVTGPRQVRRVPQVALRPRRLVVPLVELALRPEAWGLLLVIFFLS